MNELFKAIFNKFNADVSDNFYTSISGRFYLNHAPQQATLPYCVYFSVADVNEVDFTDEREDFTIQFDIFSESNSASEAGTILGYLKTMFDDCSITVTNWRHLYFQRVNVVPNNDYSQVPPIHGYSIDYDIVIEKTK